MHLLLQSNITDERKKSVTKPTQQEANKTIPEVWHI
jgi:hypothetical protein